MFSPIRLTWIENSLECTEVNGKGKKKIVEAESINDSFKKFVKSSNKG